MDLTFANEEREDIGVLKGYSLDLAYGRSENDFELMLPLKKHCLKEGYLIYVENEEYGGIVDRIEVAEDEKEITYKGRTWHGIIESKVICPSDGQDYMIVYGEANKVLQQLIEVLDLSELFEASEFDSGIEIIAYQFPRYCCAYNAMLDMLELHNAKLSLIYKMGKVVLSASNIVDYSLDEEFDDDVLSFVMEKNYRPINHLICLGEGDLKDRKVIHLFTDENGGVQPYRFKENPINDNDYIFDKRNQLLFGRNEVVGVLDEASSETTDNYVLLNMQPNDWSSNYESYFIHEFDDEGIDKFTEVKAETVDDYKLLSTKPSDWSANFAEYYIKVDGEHKNVEAIEIIEWERLKTKPSDWSNNYSNYYYWYSDGVTGEHRSVDGVNYEKMVVQTSQPTDWFTNYSSYYFNGTKHKKNTSKTWKKNTYYTYSKNKYSLLKKRPSDWAKKYKNYYVSYSEPMNVVGTGAKKNVAPKWKPASYYTKVSDTKTPPFQTYYLKKNTKTTVPECIPTFSTNKYYEKNEKRITPIFSKNTYYKIEHDNFAALIEKGIEQLKESYNSDSISINFHPDEEMIYDIGDIVGATDNTTGISVYQSISKKIVKVTETKKTIEYETGGTSE